MSIKQSFMERLGPRAQIRAIDRVPSGSPARILLRWRPGDRPGPNTPAAAVVLARRGVGLKKAHLALTRLLEGGDVVIAVPVVEDVRVLIADLAACGLSATRHEPPASLDVRAIRARTGASQEEFALRYGLDVDTVQNWEQGRSRPDAASRTVLWLIETNPEAVSSALDRVGVGGDGCG